MNRKKMAAAVFTLTIASIIMTSEAIDLTGKGTSERPEQQVIIRNQYYDHGYEFASRIKRFHHSYVTFDFYSPLFTEIYWYHFTPYTWGVSIYDDWYYYGSGVSRYTWRNGFGGSYWWGYDPWWDYDPWMGYGWSSWYSPGVSYSVNFYLGRPYYHYPMAWNRWHMYSTWKYLRPVYIINNNTYNYYYGSAIRNNYSSSRTNYNPSHPYSTGRKSPYSVSDGRSSARQAAAPSVANEATRNRTVREQANNGLRMGQYRRGTAETSGQKANEPVRTNNPNVYDRTDPGRENSRADRAPARPAEQTQRRVPTTSDRKDSEVPVGNAQIKTRKSRSENQSSVEQSPGKASQEGSDKTQTGSDTGRRKSSSQGRR